MADPEWHSVTGQAFAKCGYRLVLDNLLDLSHTAYVHTSFSGNPEVAELANVSSEVVDGMVRVTRLMRDIPPAPAFVKYGGYNGNINRWQVGRYSTPSFIYIVNGSLRPISPWTGLIRHRVTAALVGRSTTPSPLKPTRHATSSGASRCRSSFLTNSNARISIIRPWLSSTKTLAGMRRSRCASTPARILWLSTFLMSIPRAPSSSMMVCQRSAASSDGFICRSDGSCSGNRKLARTKHRLKHPLGQPHLITHGLDWVAWRSRATAVTHIAHCGILDEPPLRARRVCLIAADRGQALSPRPAAR